MEKFLEVKIYWVLKIIKSDILYTQYGGIIINSIICIIIYEWKSKYFVSIINKLKKRKIVILTLLCVLSLSSLLLVYNSGRQVDYNIAIQFLIGVIGLSVVTVWWINAENESRHKTKELQMYESYSQAFEDAIKTIRVRQHEFENHINAIKCLHYTIKDRDELISAQEKYCEKVLEENSINKLLSLNLEPILIGFLYSKIMEAQSKGICTTYDIHFDNVIQKIELYELIEILGILIDNAIEALEEISENKHIILRLTEDDSFSIEVANISRVYKNSEIEKFCVYGFSTKDNKRGVGLSRVKEITKNYGAILKIQNCEYENNNYLSFKIFLSD